MIGSGYTAMLERDRTVEAAADAIIQSLQSGEVSFGLNANLEADLIAGKITAVEYDTIFEAKIHRCSFFHMPYILMLLENGIKQHSSMRVCGMFVC